MWSCGEKTTIDWWECKHIRSCNDLDLAPPLYTSGPCFHIAFSNIFSLQAYNHNVNILSFKILLKGTTWEK